MSNAKIRSLPRAHRHWPLPLTAETVSCDIPHDERPAIPGPKSRPVAITTISAFSVSNRRKLGSVLFATTIFTLLTGLTSAALGHSVGFATTTAILVGIGVGLFEEFYVHAIRGAWLRSMHPLRSILTYTLVVIVIFFIAALVSHLIRWRLHNFSGMYARMVLAVPLFTAFSVIGILSMRILHFLGTETFFHLVVGTYHRPVIEAKVLMFIDINGSTKMAEQLGALGARSLVGKFFFDISKPITDFGGSIYAYKGDGLIATWDRREAVKENKLLQAVDAIFAAINREEAEYRRLFAVVPTFRIGVHGGDVVICEQGDDKRSIGIYGDTINIAARIEQAAKEHGVPCAVSDAVVEMLNIRHDGRLVPFGEERVRGISTPIRVYGYRPSAAAPWPSEAWSVREGQEIADSIADRELRDQGQSDGKRPLVRRNAISRIIHHGRAARPTIHIVETASVENGEPQSGVAAK
jgi:adenylate cyclase